MKKIMFVCHGNICRSPMAEMIMKSLAERSDAELYISSSATSSEEIYMGVGNPIYPPAVKKLKEKGIPVEPHFATRLTEEDLDKYDLFIGMDNMNIRNMKRILGESSEGKIFRLMDFTPRRGEVSDPWYTGDFETCYLDIYEGCLGLLRFLSQKDGECGLP